MATSKTAQLTDFTQDILGRYICHGFDEAMDSMDHNSPRPHARSDARLFNAAASALCPQDQQLPNSRSGDRTVPEHFQNLPLQRQPTPRCGIGLGMQPAIGLRRRSLP
jgi:hypothetical protein